MIFTPLTYYYAKAFFQLDFLVIMSFVCIRQVRSLIISNEQVRFSYEDWLNCSVFGEMRDYPIQCTTPKLHNYFDFDPESCHYIHRIEMQLEVFGNSLYVHLWKQNHSLAVVSFINVTLVSNVATSYDRFSTHYIHDGTVGVDSGVLVGSASGFVYNNLFDGVIVIGEVTLQVEPLNHYLNSSDKNMLIVHQSANANREYYFREYIEGFEEQPRNKRLAPAMDELKYQTLSKTCDLHLIADYTYFVHIGQRDSNLALSEMVYHVMVADRIFRSTDFNGDGLADNVGLVISNITIFTNPKAKDYYLHEDTNVPENLIQTFSFRYDHSRSCLAVLFAYRDFKGTVGISWVASSLRTVPGGICERNVITYGKGYSGPASFNTLMVTGLHYGMRIRRQVTSLTLAHEIGHGFGAMHDDPNDATCTPNAAIGHFLMNPYSTDADKPNNSKFSVCSVAYMNPVIRKKSTCFKTGAQSVCGNMRVEGGEECDCGLSVQCQLVDPCCVPAAFIGDNAGCKLARGKGYECSARFTPCCTNRTCRLVPAHAKKCLAATDCAQASYCSGQRAMCPPPKALPNGTPCRSGAGVCLNGTCQSGVCSAWGLKDCQCTMAPYRCHTCCTCSTSRGTRPCVPASVLILNLPASSAAVYRQPGQACNNYKGYCDTHHQCIVSHSNVAFDRLRTFFEPSAADELRRNVVRGICVTTAILALAVVGFILLMTYRWRFFAIGQSANRKEALSMLTDVEEEIVHVEDTQLLVSFTCSTVLQQVESGNICDNDVISRCSALFPSAPTSVIAALVEQCLGKDNVIKRLIALNYPMVVSDAPSRDSLSTPTQQHVTSAHVV